MLEQILRHLNNWFLIDKHDGPFTVENGSITLPFLQEGQYFRVVGSVFNDGLHKYPAYELKNETFNGTIWALAIPDVVVSLADKISAWQEKNGDAVESPYQSESFGGYSYTRRSGNAGAGTVSGWQDVFRTQLNDFRKMKGCEV